MRNGSNIKNGHKKIKNEEPAQFEEWSGNVFADLGLPNPELCLAKAKIVQQIRQIIDDRKLTHAKAAVLLKIAEPKVADLIRGRVANYTLDRMFKMLIALDQQVEITVTSKVKQKKARPAAVVK